MNFSVFFACFVVYVSSMELQPYLSNDVESQRDSEETEDKADEAYYKSFDREMREQEEIHIKNKLPETDEEKKFQEEEEDCDCCCTIM
uniref:Uncharacterized protein n=1 Tax=Meloidogyne javanica TaxID=6303 RepID=A0A915MVQ3_MELJA